MNVDELKQTIEEKHSGDFISQISFEKWNKLPQDVKDKLKAIDVGPFLMIEKK